MSAGALDGIVVVDFSRVLAGPYATMMLGDFGAEVIKIESTDGGDGFRAYPPMLGDQGVPYLWVNRNKRSVALDLKSPAGQAIAMDLIATADIVVENFSTGVMARFGLDYERVKQRKPDIIYCSVSSYGRNGPYANRIGFDLMRIMNTRYKIDTFQETYFVIRDFKELFDATAPGLATAPMLVYGAEGERTRLFAGRSQGGSGAVSRSRKPAMPHIEDGVYHTADG